LGVAAAFAVGRVFAIAGFAVAGQDCILLQAGYKFRIDQACTLPGFSRGCVLLSYVGHPQGILCRLQSSTKSALRVHTSFNIVLIMPQGADMHIGLEDEEHVLVVFAAEIGLGLEYVMLVTSPSQRTWGCTCE
jgi:hypothetical protein